MLSDRIRQCKARPTVSVNDLSPLALARHAVVRLPETHDFDLSIKDATDQDPRLGNLWFGLVLRPG